MGWAKLLYLEDKKEEYLTEEAKERIREDKEDELKHPFQYEYGQVVPPPTILGIACILAVIVIFLFGGK